MNSRDTTLPPGIIGATGTASYNVWALSEPFLSNTHRTPHRAWAAWQKRRSM